MDNLISGVNTSQPPFYSQPEQSGRGEFESKRSKVLPSQSLVGQQASEKSIQERSATRVQDSAMLHDSGASPMEITETLPVEIPYKDEYAKNTIVFPVTKQQLSVHKNSTGKTPPAQVQVNGHPVTFYVQWSTCSSGSSDVFLVAKGPDWVSANREPVPSPEIQKEIQDAVKQSQLAELQALNEQFFTKTAHRMQTEDVELLRRFTGDMDELVRKFIMEDDGSITDSSNYIYRHGSKTVYMLELCDKEGGIYSIPEEEICPVDIQITSSDTPDQDKNPWQQCTTWSLSLTDTDGKLLAEHPYITFQDKADTFLLDGHAMDGWRFDEFKEHIETRNLLKFDSDSDSIDDVFTTFNSCKKHRDELIQADPITFTRLFKQHELKKLFREAIKTAVEDANCPEQLQFRVSLNHR